MNTNTTKNNIRRVIASVALVGMGMATMFTATAAASPVDPSDLTFEIDELTEIEIPVLNFDPTIDISVSNCPAQWMGIGITNNYLNLDWFRVHIFNSSTVEVTEDPEFEFSETPDFESGVMAIASGDSSGGPYFTDENVVLVKVYETGPGPVDIVGYGTLIHEEEVTICEEGAEAELAEAAAEHAAQVAAEEAAQALLEAQEAAEAAEQALLEAQEAADAAAAAAAEDAAEAAAQAAAAAEAAAQAAIDQANAETEAAQAALAQAEAEKELALAQVEVEKAKAEAILAQSQGNGETAENTHSDEISEENETSDEELAAGEDLGNHSKSGMSGAVLGLIIVLGLVGVAAVTGAVLNLRKQR